MPHFDSTITLGNILTIIAFSVAALLWYSNTNWRLKIVEEWKAAHEHTTLEALRNIEILSRGVAAMEQIAKGQDRRLVLLEDRAISFPDRAH